MDFGLSEQQLSMQESLRRYLQQAAGLEHLRSVVADGPVHDATLWQGLADMGLTGLLVPQAYGGLGLPLMDAVLVQEVLGEFAAPVCFTASAILAPLALALAGSDAQQEKWLPRLVDGSLQVAVCITDAGGSREDAGVTAVNDKLNGRLMFALGAASAELLICSCREGDLYLVHRDAPGLEWTSMRSVDDTRCLWEIKLREVAAELLLPEAGDALAPVSAAGRIALAADTLGAAQTMLDKAVAYSCERQQFDRLIGSFQAVKHMCAEMAAELEPCRALLWYAAYAYDAVPDKRTLLACHAKAHLGEVGTSIARTATEVHGGMGFTDLLGLHYWFKRIGFNRQVLGSPDRLRAQAARVQGWGVQADRLMEQGGGYR
ncbi:(R)-benzylsuccinyl-CoA dehydrogenase [Halioglobus japonicus]|nr:(R)-benzylsuccinyl-CoA dehydrogenase [Halioglobus japonicus]